MGKSREMHESVTGSEDDLPVERPGIREGDLRHDHGFLGSSLRRRMAEARQRGFAGIFDTRHAAPPLLRYLSGLAVWMASFSLRLLIQPLTPYSPFLPFIPALMLVGWLWGRGPALLYLATTTIVVSIYFVPGPGQFQFDDATHVAAALQSCGNPEAASQRRLPGEHSPPHVPFVHTNGHGV